MILENSDSVTAGNVLTRRQMITGVAVAFGSLAGSSAVFSEPEQESRKQQTGATGNERRTSLHREDNFNANPQRIYEGLLDAKQFAAFSGMPAEIDPKEGGIFSLFDGMIVGRNVELVSNKRIVQAWRPTHWNPGVYSIVKFELKPWDSGTSLNLDQTGFPEGEFDSLSAGWTLHYLEPLKKFLV